MHKCSTSSGFTASSFSSLLWIAASALLAVMAWVNFSIPSPPAPPAKPRLVPAGKFAAIRSVAAATEDQDLRSLLAECTCFAPASSPAEADAIIYIDTFLQPPPGKTTYTLGEATEVFKARLVDRNKNLLWRGSESTLQRMVPAPGVHLAPGQTFYKDIPPADAKRLLLSHLRLAACTAGK